ncbi:MAG TPA: hypothetical protein VFB59_04025, partial [Candidatus Saccharimonadales bacterium]|nr:hypothetical protein [Candidatus Saccharimonadales bacterium]
DEDRATIRPWIKLMGFNLPGWAQSQASVSHLELFPESLGRKLRLQFILHGMLDVMGVRGNENQTSALAYTKPTHDMFIAAVKALTWSAEELGLPVGTEMTPDLRERAYLQLRAVYFGVTQDYYQHTCRPVDPVLAEVATMPLGEQILVDAHATMNARELLAQIRLANAARYSSHKQFAALRRAYADCSYLDLEPITDIMGLSQLKILFPLFDIHQPQKDFVFDYLPAFIRPLLSGDHETLKRNLKLFAGILYEIRYAYGNLPRLDEFEDQPSVDMVAVFKTLAQRAKESKSSTKETGILVRQVGNVLVPEIVTLEEKFSYEDDLAQQKRLTMLRQYWGGRDDIPDHIRRELEES